MLGSCGDYFARRRDGLVIQRAAPRCRSSRRTYMSALIRVLRKNPASSAWIPRHSQPTHEWGSRASHSSAGSPAAITAALEVTCSTRLRGGPDPHPPSTLPHFALSASVAFDIPKRSTIVFDGTWLHVRDGPDRVGATSFTARSASSGGEMATASKLIGVFAALLFMSAMVSGCATSAAPDAAASTTMPAPSESPTANYLTELPEWAKDSVPWLIYPDGFECVGTEGCPNDFRAIFGETGPVLPEGVEYYDPTKHDCVEVNPLGMTC